MIRSVYIQKNMNGAINSRGEYIRPEDAIRANYSCPECGKDVILKRGKVNAAHFAHVDNQEECPYYDKKYEVVKIARYNKSRHDKAQKRLMKFIRKGYEITILKNCKGRCIDEIILPVFEPGYFLEKSFDIGLEHPVDLIYITNNKRFIIEIINVGHIQFAHDEDGKTTFWFELSVNRILESHSNNKYIVLKDKRETYSNNDVYCEDCRARITNYRNVEKSATILDPISEFKKQLEQGIDDGVIL